MLTRKMLKAMGIVDDVIEQVIEAHTETVDALKKQRDSYKADAEKGKSLSDELDKANARIKELEEDTSQDELKKANEKQGAELEKLKKANESLQAEFDRYKSDTEAKETMRKKSDAYSKLLEKAGVAPKYAGKVLKVTKLDDVELDEEGKVKDADKAIEGIKSEWPEFITQTKTQGANTETPPVSSNTPQGVSERAQRIIAQHYESKYGKSKE